MSPNMAGKQCNFKFLTKIPLMQDECACLGMYDGLSKLDGWSERRFIENSDNHFICSIWHTDCPLSLSFLLLLSTISFTLSLSFEMLMFEIFVLGSATLTSPNLLVCYISTCNSDIIMHPKFIVYFNLCDDIRWDFLIICMMVYDDNLWWYIRW